MMKTLLIGISCMLLVSCASQYERVRLDKSPDAKFLDKAALETVIVALQNLQYPLTRAETLKQLHLTDRQLPSMRSTESEAYINSALHTNDYETIQLTDTEKKGRRYTLLLWYDHAARKLGGDSFVTAKIINYCEILVEDDGTEDAPKARYIVQSFRYPYLTLEYPRQPSAQK